MNIKIAGIDLFSQGLDNEYRIAMLERIVEKILLKNPTALSQKDLADIRSDVVKILQQKYPEAGIDLVEVKK